MSEQVIEAPERVWIERTLSGGNQVILLERWIEDRKLGVEYTRADIAAQQLEQAVGEKDERIAELERRLRIPFGKLPCARCGGPHDFDTSVPSVMWNRVIRAKGLPEYLCTTCIVREFVRAGEGFTATLWGEEFNGVPIEIVVNGQNAKDASAIQEENNDYRNQLSELRATQAEAVEKAKRDTWEKAITAIKAAYIYGPGSIALERDGAIEARAIIIAALEVARDAEAGNENCADCDTCARSAYSDGTTAGFMYSKCERHRRGAEAGG